MMKLLLKAELPILVVAGILGQKIAAKLWSVLFKAMRRTPRRRTSAWHS